MKLRARDILLLVVGWSFVAVALVVLVLVFRSRISEPAGVPEPVATHTVVFTQVTALGLYPKAEGVARAWQPDARLVSVTATWRNTAINLVGQPTQWVFRFYSPALRRYYFVTVQPDGQTQAIEHARQVDLSPPGFPVEAWRVNSVEALATWLDYGGGDMLGDMPGIEVSAQLNVPAEGGDPLWTVVGYDARSNAYLTVMVHATSGKVIRTVSPSP
ncbi:MAG: hypothetical protein Kow0063_00830 [Anaerolineae bacterium]